ncbi:hypothetical protein Tco_0157118 [Tanacetum coccineum]
MIIVGADNRPPMLDKSMYDLWKSQDGTTRTKKYEELSVTKKLQADCDLKATNIVLQGLPSDVYAIVNHHKVAKEIWDRVKLLMQGTKLSLQEREGKLYDEFDKFSFVKGLAVFVFTQGDDPIVCLNKAMVSCQLPPFKTAGLQCNKFKGAKDKVMLVKDTWLGNALSLRGQGTLHGLRTKKCWLKHGNLTEDLDAYDSNCDDVSNAKAVLMANLSKYGSDVISEVPYSESYHNDVDNQSVHAMHDFEQTSVVDFPDNEITSDSNIIPYSQYLQETQQEAVQDTNLYAQQDSMILSVIEQMSEQMINLRLNIDLSTHEKMIDSQMDDMIKKKLALKQQIDSLEQNLSNQIKEKESLLQTFTVFKNESKERKPTLYDGSVISSPHAVIPVIDDEETLILEELNQLSKDFGKRLIPQQELSAEQAFWLQTSHPNTDQSDISLVKTEAPRELLKTLKDIFNVFDKDLLNEVTEVQTVFNQMEAAVQQCSVDKQCFEIRKKELFLDNDRLLHQIISQDVMLCVMNSTAIFGDSVNLEMQSSDSYDKCSDLDIELLEKQNAYNELLRSYSQLEKHFIYLELTMQLNQEIFQKDKSWNNQNALEILEYSENNDLKAQLQAKDTTIRKLKEHIKSMR